MNTMQNLYWTGVNKYLSVKEKAKEKMTEMTAGVSHTSEVLIILVIVLIIAVVFKTKTAALVNKMFEKANTQSDTLFQALP